MKSLREYIVESEHRATTPVAGDNFEFEFDDGTVVQTYIIETSDDEILVAANNETIAVMEQWCGLGDILYEDVDFSQCEAVLEHDSLTEGSVKHAMHKDAENMSRNDFTDKYGVEHGEFWDNINGELSEAEYRGRKVPLGKPMRGDVKKFKVYVKDPKTGNVKKVNFGHGGTSAKRLGQKTMKIKKSNPARRKSFRARHNCDNPGPRTKARYWSCRAW
jgi:hypothetical protein